ncbi:uncharacterized protein LOC117649258 [Thrips palmi]|uniref:Uncharacterized protein LOC117649258 n=1 Tax=Thrips palmi TaxID=161013 RepID=A0A6P8ZAH1_THRPL|nr:uncharacterized protein LOC117649258 [Thrips palmi]
MSSFKRSLNRKACKAVEKRIRLDTLMVQLGSANTLANDSSSDIADDAGGIVVNEQACDLNSCNTGPDDCEGEDLEIVGDGDTPDNVPGGDAPENVPDGDVCNLGDGNGAELPGDDVHEGSSTDSENDREDDIASDEDVRPVFQNERERELFVIDSVREWAQEPGVLSMTKLDHLLHRLSAVFPNMPLTYTTLFACDYDFQISELPSGGLFWYKGIRTNLDSLSLGEYLLRYKQVTVDIGIDGLPLKKKGVPSKLWPILGHLVGSINEPFIIAVFKGSHDPKSVEEFLADYVAEVQDLMLNGYTFQGKVYKFVVRFYVLDAVARQAIKRIETHNGYAACESCEVYGEYIDNRMVFLDLDAPLRSDESFLHRNQPKHHKGISPLEACGTGMVTQFRHDPMHLIYGGAFKRLLDFWLNQVGVWKLHHEVVNLISSVFEFLKPYCPSDFNRKPLSLKYFSSYKCTEFRRILLYDGILAFKDLVDSNIYKHFLLLHCSVYIMCSRALFAVHRELVVELLRTFISHSAVIYGRKFVVYNIHSLFHIVNELDEDLTLDDISAFKYENRLKSIKDALRSGLHPLQQLARRDKEKTSSSVLLPAKPTCANVSLKHRVLNEVVDGQQYKKLKAGSLKLRLGKADSCFQTKDGDIVVLQNIVCRQRRVYLVGCKFSKLEDYYVYPLPSSQLGIYRVSLLERERRVYRLSDLHSKCYLMPDGEFFVCVPILHSTEWL